MQPAAEALRVGGLSSIKPRRSLSRSIGLFVLALVVCAVLVSSYRATGINPGLLWSNREKADEFLFGRSVTDEQQAQARAQAERMPRMMATQQASRDLRDELMSAGKPIPREPELGRQVSARADVLLTQQSAGQQAAQIDREYQANLAKLRGGFFPPELSSEKLSQYFAALLETLAIALWGTLLAVLCAFPLALLASQRTLEILASGDAAHHRAVRWLSRTIVRRFMDVCRGFNEFVLALIIVAVIGLGPFTGVLALFIHSTGILGKIFAEAMDAAEPGPIEGVASGGARPTQIISFAVFPQVLPYLVSNSLLRFETNVRSATILGVVGAGGIGFLMSDKINGYQYREACTMMLMILLTVTLIDLLCSRLLKAAL
jgi:phosphonate transport system permease protein